MNWRNPKLLDLARHAPHCMRCDGQNRGDVVMAHSNQQRDGKGKSIKAHDYRVAALCWECHGEIDQGHTMSREERRSAWEEAHRRTIGWLFEAGFLAVREGVR